MTNELLINLSFVIPKPTGLATYARNLFPHLRSLHPTLLSAQPVADYHTYPVPPNLTPDQGSRGHFNRLVWTQRQLPKIYQKLRSRLLFSPIPEAPIASKCRYVVTVHDLIPLRFPRRFSPLLPYHKYYIPQVLRRAECILCDSEATASDIVNFYRIPAEKITPVPLACDTNRFEFLDLPTSHYFFYIGRHDPYKNLNRLIAAFAAMPSKQACELWIAGPPDPRYTPILQTQAQELGIGDRVKFLGYVDYDKLPTLINQAIALVFPSLWEGFGLPVLEAMACGTPVVTSNLSSLPEVAGDAALLVDPYNVSDISVAMNALATEPQTRSRLRTLGLTRSRQFSWTKTGRTVARILSQYL